jgi:putative transposase
MPHTYVDLVVHFVFSTKDRRPFLTPERQQLIWPYMGGIAKQNRIKPIIIGGIEDHVHMLLAMPSDMDPATAMQYVKGGSSKWFRENHLTEFQWQQGFAAFGVSHSLVSRRSRTSEISMNTTRRSTSKPNTSYCWRSTASHTMNVTCGDSCRPSRGSPRFWHRVPSRERLG